MGSGCLACFARSQTPLDGAGGQASAAAAAPAAAPPPVPAANPAPFSHEWVERLPEGEFKQELMDCLGQGGTPSDVADLAYSLFPPAPPGVVLPPHPDLPGVQLHQPGLPAPQTLPSATCGGGSWTLFFYAHKLTATRRALEKSQRGLPEAQIGYGYGMLPGYGPPDINPSSLVLDGSPA